MEATKTFPKTDSRPRWLRHLAAALIVSSILETNAALEKDADGATRAKALGSLKWMTTEDRDNAISFGQLCSLLGLDPDRLRPRAKGLVEFLDRESERHKAGPLAAKRVPVRMLDPDRPLTIRRRIRLLERVLEHADPRHSRLGTRFNLEKACERLGIDPAGDVAEQAEGMLIGLGK